MLARPTRVDGFIARSADFRQKRYSQLYQRLDLHVWAPMFPENRPGHTMGIFF